MPRSAYIYHLYHNEKRILSATVKSEILWKIHEKGYTSETFTLKISGDNSEGENEVLGWRQRPNKDDKVVFVDGIVEKIVKVGDLNHSGNWSVETEHFGKLMIYWSYNYGQWEQYCSAKSRKSRQEASE